MGSCADIWCLEEAATFYLLISLYGTHFIMSNSNSSRYQHVKGQILPFYEVKFHFLFLAAYYDGSCEAQ